MKIFVLLLALLLPLEVYAQQAPIATPNSRIEWSQSVPTGVTITAAEVQAYTYRYYPNLSVTGITLTGVTCTGTAPNFVCSAPMPVLSQGSNTIQLTAGNAGGESPKSSPFAFNFVVVPNTPSSIRIIPPPQ